jgi:hypothetical protein
MLAALAPGDFFVVGIIISAISPKSIRSSLEKEILLSED